MKEANGYNLISSKSTKILPLMNKKLNSTTARNGSQVNSITTPSATLKTQRLNRVGDNVQNIIAREQVRDGKLANRLKIINNKQAARIREIETQELKNQ